MSATTLTKTGRARRGVRRRLLVGVSLLSCAVIFATGLTDGRATGLVSIAGALAWFPAYFLLRREVEDAADLPDDRLDEREISLRDRSYLAAYRLLGGAIAASLLLAIVDDAVDGQIVESWLSPLAAVVLLSAVLPSAVLATMQTPDATPE